MLSATFSDINFDYLLASLNDSFGEPACGERYIVVTTSVRCKAVCCACVVRADLPGPKLLNLCMNFKIIGHSCFP